MPKIGDLTQKLHRLPKKSRADGTVDLGAHVLSGPMKTHRDSAGHTYITIQNLRLTYIPAGDRPKAKNWGLPGREIPAGFEEAAPGAEFPVGSSQNKLNFVEAFCFLCRTGEEKRTDAAAPKA